MRKQILAFIILQMFAFAYMSYVSPVYSKTKPGTAAVFKKNKPVGITLRKDITGTVRDSIGVMPGVSVKIKGSTNGTTTDGNGRYILNVPDEAAVLVFSMVGYATQEIPVSGKTVINVTLKPSQNALDEVVVVAFGTQKKTDMVGSVTSISAKDLKVPSSNLTTALAGRAAGIIAYQRSGEPGQDNADFFVRGITTFGSNTKPLILIDGMELTSTDLARLQPDDIASFSILKDATSTAVYGARGANGIILVTTKQGAVGKAKLALRLENSVSSATKDLELADPITYMQLSNEAILTRNPLGTLLYSEEKIANTITGKNPLAYPANDWKKMMFKDNAITQRANLSISGGGGVAKYFVSGAYNKDNGMLNVDNRNNYNNNIDLKSYTLRSNVTIDVTKSTEMIVRLSGNFDDYTGPIDGGSGMYRKVMRSNPTLFPAYFPIDEQHKFVKHIMYGNFGAGNYLNPYADMTKGYKDYSRSLMLAQLEVKQDLAALTPGLSFRTMLNTNRTSYFDVSRSYIPYLYTLAGYDQLNNTYAITNLNEDTGTEYLGYSEGEKQVETSFYLESMFNYSRNFNKHGLNGLLVYRMMENRVANAGDLQESLPFRNLGVSGRATYSYDNRYFAEFNFGYNGSERFHESKRFGFFPAGGVAWNISNEKFFKELKPIFSNLKLRATYGLIGNDAIGDKKDRFFYLSNVNMNTAARGAVFGNGQGPMFSLNGVSVSRYSNADISWETATKKNFALEIGLFNKLNIQAEYYTEMRDNILMSRSVPVTLGLSAPVRANVGKASGKGTDISVDYTENLSNGMWFSARGNFTYASSKYLVYEEPQYNEFYRSHVGYPLNQTYGYIAERLFVDDAEALNSPKQNFGEYGGGDIKYTDVNRDGQITDADKVPIGNPTVPQIIYGFGFSMGIKNFDFSGFFQGLANESFWIDAEATSPFANYRTQTEIDNGTLAGRVLNNQLLKAYADSHWSEDNRNVYALWPRLSPEINQNNAQTSTWFMRDGSFLRLKTVEVGYTLPKSWQKKVRASTFRIYASATNLLTFSKFKLWDVEMGGNGLGYPLQKVFNLGVNITFN
ncbi:TonB-dependent receptor [Pedobacter heparinus]|uniref:SusC/RagA family TonB-linked outer membrane protein n=1 Tax=Pedobacter heparinus TaxID=984 RepID=UPI0029316DF1|nr:TonB-dependent receptor [Pedobacter heparinus]